jgi:peptidoglycan/xylan/chitin deacetylase (PgdA/CDA1 family)
MFDLTLTFDNGPEPEVTPLVLDALARRGILASFFVLGRKIADPARRRLAERAKAEGHWIANHTWTHDVPLGLMRDPVAAAAEITDTQTELGALVHPDHLFRPFGGGGILDRRLLQPSALRVLEAGRYTTVLWNAVPRDWENIEGWVEVALAQCAERPWTQIVLHDLPTGAMARLEDFLDRAAAAGARFRQEFCPDCIAMQHGVAAPALAAYVNDGSTTADP